jgi:prepilin-type N-terminal cleavage/methylation domain-containing protein
MLGPALLYTPSIFRPRPRESALIRRLKTEAGYSLVEVMVAIMILLIAIIPMVSMFDTGLKTATLGSNYDRARALADTNLDKVRSLPWSTATVTYEPVNAPVTATNPATGTPVSCNQGMFTCTVTTTLVDPTDNFASDPLYNVMKIEVTVMWQGDKTYTTTGLKSQ